MKAKEIPAVPPLFSAHAAPSIAVVYACLTQTRS